MIIYNLTCDSGHEFEGWFKNSEDLADQQRRGLLTCPVCDSVNVERKLTAPRVTRKSNTGSVPNNRPDNRKVAISGQQSPEDFAKLQQMLQQVHQFVDANFEDVGNRFTEKAIDIHRGDRDPANIRGTATNEQLKQLEAEGVQTIALPPKPIDKKKLN